MMEALSCPVDHSCSLPVASSLRFTGRWSRRSLKSSKSNALLTLRTFSCSTNIPFMPHLETEQMTSLPTRRLECHSAESLQLTPKESSYRSKPRATSPRTVDWVSWWITSFPCWVKNKVQLSASQSSVHSASGVNLSLRSVRRTCFYRPSQKGHLLHVQYHLCHQKHLAGTLPHLCLKTNKVVVLCHLGNINCTTAPQSWTSLREKPKTNPSVTLMGCR